MSKARLIIKLMRKNDASGFHKLCRDLEEDEWDLSEKTFNNLQLVGFDLSNFNLSNTEWENCNFTQVKFDATNLAGAYFNGCCLVDCSCIETDFDGTSFDGSILRDISVQDSNLSSFELENTQLQTCAFASCNFEDIQWTNVSFKTGALSDVQNATGNWNGVDLRNVALANSDLSNIEMSRSYHHACTFSNSPLPEKGITTKSGRRRSV